MSIVTIVLLCVGAALFLIWVLSAVSIVVGIRRRQRVTGANGSSGSKPPLPNTPALLDLSLGLTLNVLTFILATAWYRLRGKPLPPPPKLGP
jgi:hypothetical protein